MTLDDFKKKLIDVKIAYENAQSNNVDLYKEPSGKLYDFKESRENSFRNAYFSALQVLRKSTAQLTQLIVHDPANASHISEANALIEKFDKTEDKIKVIEDLNILVDKIKIPVVETLKIKIPKVPSDIQADVSADLKEVELCFNNECYRSVVILCGRLLETALHRKYYESTGNDLLEKSPGIGLGNLIAKMSEKNISFDPGLTQQIHLINQVRIFSVHKKQRAFYPSKAQTYAMILYTLDIVEKIFK